MIDSIFRDINEKLAKNLVQCTKIKNKAYNKLYFIQIEIIKYYLK